MLPPVNDILLFVEVFKHGSFSVAAEKQGKTPAMVSKRITQLEEMLGVKLLVRNTRSLALTEAGQTLYDNCKNMQLNLQSTIESVLNTHQKPKGKIRISSMVNLSNLVLTPLISKFLEEYDNIEVEMQLGGSLSELPPIGEYDIAFRSGKLEDSSAISRRFFSHDYVVCASPRYLERYGTPRTLDDLKHHNCIDCRHSVPGRENVWTFFQDEEEYHVPVKGNIFTNNALLIKYFGLNHGALIYSPSFIVADDINAGLLVPVLTNYKTVENPITLIHPYADGIVPQRVRTFIDFLFKHLQVPTVHKKNRMQLVAGNDLRKA